MSNNSAFVIFSGYNNRAVIALLRTLTSNNINYLIIARDSKDPILKTHYSKNVIMTRESSEFRFKIIQDYLVRQIEDKGLSRIFIAPSTEYILRKIIEFGSTNIDPRITIPLNLSSELYQDISDKRRFTSLCKSNNLLVPEEYKFSKEMNLPIVAKPKKYISNNGKAHKPFIIHTRSEFNKFINDHPDKDSFFFQEYLEGESIYMLYYFKNNGEYIVLSQKNLAQEPNGGSIVYARSSKHYKRNIAKKYAELFKNIGFHGLVMVELRKVGRKYYLIEANPRMWGPSQLFVDWGVNLFEHMLKEYDLINKKLPKARYVRVRYFWWEGYQSIPSNNIQKECIIQKSLSESTLRMLKSLEIFNREDTINIFK